jgi:glyoxylase-like metal-dependent hydrolase (beta-lactamase superfamily II)
MLNEVADGVWVRQSAWVWSNAIAVRGEGGLILVDPGIDGSDLNQLADDLDRLGIPVVAGFSTHPHWDHLLWHPRFGDVPRYATPPAPTLPVKPESGRRGWRRRARRASLSS